MARSWSYYGNQRNHWRLVLDGRYVGGVFESGAQKGDWAIYSDAEDPFLYVPMSEYTLDEAKRVAETYCKVTEAQNGNS